MAKRPHDEPRRVESAAKMTVAEEAPAVQEPVMKTAAEPIPLVGEDWRELVKLADIPAMKPIESDPQIVAMFPDGLIRPNMSSHEIVNGPPGTFQAHTESTPSPHNPMATVPRDGTMVNLIREDGSEVRVVWRSSRRYNARDQRWEPTGFWSSPMNRFPVEVDAVGWRMADGFAQPGMIHA